MHTYMWVAVILISPNVPFDVEVAGAVFNADILYCDTFIDPETCSLSVPLSTVVPKSRLP